MSGKYICAERFSSGNISTVKLFPIRSSDLHHNRECVPLCVKILQSVGYRGTVQDQRFAIIGAGGVQSWSEKIESLAKQKSIWRGNVVVVVAKLLGYIFSRIHVLSCGCYLQCNGLHAQWQLMFYSLDGRLSNSHYATLFPCYSLSLSLLVQSTVNCVEQVQYQYK